MSDALPLDENLLAEITGLLQLREPNRAAVETLSYELWRHYDQEHYEHPFEGVIDSATGVGKTYVIVAAVEYLARARGVRDFVVVSPSRVVLDKTIEQFTSGVSGSIVDLLSVPVQLVTAETFNSAATARAMDDPDIVKVYAFTLAAAIAERYVNTPVIVGRKDDKHDLATKLLDGLVLLDHKQAIAQDWSQRQGLPAINPIMLVVARNTEEADQIADTIRSDSFREGRHRAAVLVVHSNAREADEPAALARLSAVEDPDSPIRVVVSVAMLKEGWDVKNVYVLLSTQPSVSVILTEQVLGRGLRLPWGKYQGVEMLDTLEVLAHERYEDLLAKRGVLAEQFVDYITRSFLRANAAGEPVVVRETEEITTGLGDKPTASNPAVAAGDADPQVMPGGPSGSPQPGPTPTLTSSDERLAAGEAEEALATPTLAPRRVIRVPRVRVVPRPVVFRLSDVHDDEPFQALGRRLRADPQTELRRVLLGARVVLDPATGTKTVRPVTSTATDTVRAQGSLIPASELRGQLRDTLLTLPVLTARADDGTQTRAADRIVAAFMDGLNGGADELLAAYLERAGARLGQIVMAEYRKHVSRPDLDPVVDLVSLDQVRTNTRAVNPDPRALPVRGQAFDGWKRGLYALAWFDSSTERDLALVADNSDLVDVWVRLHQGDLPIVWTEGGNRYEPHFVIVEVTGEHLLVEVKADRDLSSNEVRAKRDAAQRWAAYANDGLPQGGPRWSYLLISETDLREAKEDWAALKKLAE